MGTITFCPGFSRLSELYFHYHGDKHVYSLDIFPEAAQIISQTLTSQVIVSTLLLTTVTTLNTS